MQFANSCYLISFLKQYLNIFIRNFVLCIQIRFVSTEKTTRIASRASCYKLLNTNYCDTILKSSIMSKLDNVQYSNDMIISIKLIQEAVGNLECGKSAGPDGIFAESIKFAHHRIHVLLSLCFSLCLTHGYMPLDMIKTTIVPVIKNKCANLADSNKYRPIAIATIVSKLCESTILYKCEDFLKTCDNQFGFKRKHSTEFCIYTLKEFIDYYKQRGTTIFVTFLDASKAFDKIDFWLLCGDSRI